MMGFFYKEKIIKDMVVGVDFQQNLNGNISLLDEFLEALKFFFKHPIAFWYKENKAEYRIKVERFADEMKDRSFSINGIINGENKQASVFDLLKDASKILTPSCENIDQKILK